MSLWSKKMKVQFLCTAILVVALAGCGKKDEGMNNPSGNENVQQEAVADESASTDENDNNTDAKEESDANAASSEAEEKPVVDLETFAAQEDNTDVCVAVYNENTNEQIVLKVDPANSLGQMRVIQEGDRIFIPIRDNYASVSYNDNGEIIELYAKGKTEQTKYVGFDAELGKSYSIIISPEGESPVVFGVVSN